MNLKRYNEILIAVVGTCIALGVPALIIWSLVFHHGPERPPGVVIEGGATPRPKQVLSMCAPLEAPGTAFSYFPIAAVRTDGQHGNISLGSAYKYYVREGGVHGVGMDCKVEREQSYAVVNVVIRDSATGSQGLLLSRQGQVISVDLPDAKCATGEGPAPCGTAFWLVRDEDTNQDGVINFNDAAILYASDLAGQHLFRLSPKGTTVVDWSWNRRSGEVLIQGRRILSKDGKFVTQDGVELFSAKSQPPAAGLPVLQAQVLEPLRRAIE